ncbi:hypothetical protein CPB85DRAFT_1438069 [Mucidula mucida]|nr:hypothetical protein CPB85DRAFT_1438069 [Mucidula mucida]
MPEFMVLKKFMKEARLHASDMGSPGLPASNPAKYGRLGVFPDTLVCPSSARQLVTIHSPPPKDPCFLLIAKPRNTQKKKKSAWTTSKCATIASCTRCPKPSSQVSEPLNKLPRLLLNEYSHLKNKSAAAILNGLQITGQLFPVACGKELIFGVSTFLIHICFGLKGHLLWIPTKEFNEMTSVPAVSRGAKSKTFTIPDHLFHGPPGSSGQASIQLFFRRPDWTLIVLDHNVMISFHVMRLHHVCTQDDLQPGSVIWNYIWSKSHGPVWHLEPEAMLRALQAWRETIIENKDMTAVFVAVKARIHPYMPIYCIATNSELWDHFVYTHREYQLGRLHMLATTQLTNVLEDGAFCFNEDAHIRFLRTIPIYCRATVCLKRDTFLSVLEQNLLNPKATLCDNGTASLIQEHDNDTPFYQPVLEPPVQIAHIQPGTQTKQVPIYRLAIPRVPGSSKKVNVYTPITAKIPTSWGVTIQSFLDMLPEEDILKVQHKTTLGPYSFDLFVAASVCKRPRAISLKGKENKMPNKKKRLSLLFAALRVSVGEEQLEKKEKEEDKEEDKEDKEDKELSSNDKEA